LDHLLSLDGEQVGLPVYPPKLEFGAIVCQKATFGVDAVQVFVTELDVVVVEIVDFFVCFIRVETFAFGVQRVCQELANWWLLASSELLWGDIDTHNHVSGERFREEAVKHHCRDFRVY
jgi:hypothetical protein